MLSREPVQSRQSSLAEFSRKEAQYRRNRKCDEVRVEAFRQGNAHRQRRISARTAGR